MLRDKPSTSTHTFSSWIYSYTVCSFILLPAAAKAKIGIWTCEFNDVSVRAWRLAPSVKCSVATIVVERANRLSVSSGFSCCSVNGNLSVTVGVWRVGTDLSTGFLIGCVAHKNYVFTASTSSWTRASSASSGGRHVERLPAQVVQWVPVVTSGEIILWQMAGLVEQGKTTRLTGFDQVSFYYGQLSF